MIVVSGDESQLKADDANGLLARWPLFLDNYFVPRGDTVAIEFEQAIGATDALRTGTYAKTLTFTLSTANP